MINVIKAKNLGGFAFRSKFCLQTPIPISKFHTTNLVLEKRWKDLSVESKQSFIRSFVDLYKEKHPCSKSNVMYKELSADMEEHGDTPYVFGILYNELLDVSLGKSVDNEEGKGPMGDKSFLKLIYKD